MSKHFSFGRYFDTCLYIDDTRESTMKVIVTGGGGHDYLASVTRDGLLEERNG